MNLEIQMVVKETDDAADVRDCTMIVWRERDLVLRKPRYIGTYLCRYFNR